MGDDIRPYSERWEKFIYHYTTAETALDYILTSNTLRFGSLQHTNDPREFLDWSIGIKGIIPNGGDYGEQIDIREFASVVNGACRKNAKLGCFAMDALKTSRELLYGNEPRGIRGFERPRMWAQYAARYTGICLCFFRDQLVQQAREHFASVGRVDARPVTYVPFRARTRGCGGFVFDNHPSFADIEGEGSDTIREHIWEIRDAVYFEKMADWSEECEFRIAALTEAEEPEYVSIGDSLAGIVVGQQASKDTIQKIIRHANERSIGAARMLWETGSPWKEQLIAGDEDSLHPNDPFSDYLYY